MKKTNILNIKNEIIMKYVTEEMEKLFKKIGKQDNPDPIVVAKFYEPLHGENWYATEYNPNVQVFFGYITNAKKKRMEALFRARF